MSNDQTPKWEPEKNAELCAEISGFLFQHPCGMFARYRCHQCEKPICVAHSVDQGKQTICESCSKSPTSQSQTSPNRRWLQDDYWYDIDVTIDDRPIWFRRKGGIRKPGSSRRLPKPPANMDDDFTDADEIGFANNGPHDAVADQAWENDMGAS